MFSNIWICHACEIFSLFNKHESSNENSKFNSLHHDLRLIRVPLKKSQIAKDNSISEVLKIQRTYSYVYDPEDPLKSYFPSHSLSERGSVMWEVFDVEENPSRPNESVGAHRWLERLSISERIVGFPGAGVKNQ